jgi:hypothetical protein
MPNLIYSQYSKPFNNRLLKNFNLSINENDTLYSVLINDDGKDLIFIINNSDKKQSLPTYKDLVIFNNKCDFKKLAVNSAHFGFVSIPQKNFIVFIPNKNNSPCP